MANGCNQPSNIVIINNCNGASDCKINVYLNIYHPAITWYPGDYDNRHGNNADDKYNPSCCSTGNHKKQKANNLS